MKLGDWIVLLSLVAACVILWQFRQALLLIFAAIVVAIALNSLVRWLQTKLPLKRGKALMLALVIVVLGSGLVLSLVLPPFLVQFQALIQFVPKGIDQSILWIQQFLENPPPWIPELPKLDLPTLSRLTQQFEPFARQIVGNFFAFFQSSVAVLVQVLLALILTLMFSANPNPYRKLAVRSFPSAYRRRADEILSQCETTLLSWMQGIVLSSTFVAGCSAIALSLLGIPYVLAHALLAGFFNFIPNVGPAASMIFPVSVALAISPWKAVTVGVIYIVIQNLESYWFSPMVMQKQVSLLPVVTLTAQLFFASFLGFLGLLLALPLTVVAKVWIEEAWVKDILDRPHLDQAVAPPAAAPALPPGEASADPVNPEAAMADPADGIEPDNA